MAFVSYASLWTDRAGRKGALPAAQTDLAVALCGKECWATVPQTCHCFFRPSPMFRLLMGAPTA
jgi:hypothetical protein